MLMLIGLAGLVYSCEGDPLFCFCLDTKGTEYKGNTDVTLNNNKCASWSVNGVAGIPENVCRNPEGAKARPWCFIDSLGNWEFCKVPECGCDSFAPLECGCSGVNLGDYRGTINRTKSGKVCQAWSENWPQRHQYNPKSEEYKQYGLESNYCRNPELGWVKPWCYVADGSTRWEECDIPQCDNTTTSSTVSIPADSLCANADRSYCYCEITKGVEYEGYSSTTVSHDICKEWRYTDEPQLPHNYCRNPRGEKEQPWCYTDYDGSWGYCNVPTCGCTDFDPENCGCLRNGAADYRGKVNRTVSGKLCQSWASQEPNRHYYRPEHDSYKAFDLSENYCRNPDMEWHKPWCFVADGSARWEECEISICDLPTTTEEVVITTTAETTVLPTTALPTTVLPTTVLPTTVLPTTVSTTTSLRTTTPATPATREERLSGICSSGDGSNYKGTLSSGIGCKQCVNWSLFEGGSADDVNYCRNPDGREMPWCYTSVLGDWVFCSLPDCYCGGADDTSCGCKHLKQADYNGTINKSVSGKECLDWPAGTEGGYKNYCRNPGMSGEKAWCYTSAGVEYCDVPDCPSFSTSSTTTTGVLPPISDCKSKFPSQCGCASARMSDYRGMLNITEHGFTCIEWKDAPYYQDLELNYCRNPDGVKEKAWCYIDTNGAWQTCNVSECSCEERDEKTCGCADVKQSDYRGDISFTHSGKKCQKWSSQHPHKHIYTPDTAEVKYYGLDENYCRNPGMEGEQAWCYVDGLESRWEYCAVPSCGGLETISSTTTYLPCLGANSRLCGCSTYKQSDYTGFESVTETGKTCAIWSGTKFNNLIGNFCRNPDSKERAWCYVEGGKWEYCNIPFCGCHGANSETCGCAKFKQADYRGSLNVTKSGKPCQKWSEQTPNRHKYDLSNEGTRDFYAPFGLEENYCRNPDMDGGSAWCYVADGSTRWEECEVPVCQ